MTRERFVERIDARVGEVLADEFEFLLRRAASLASTTENWPPMSGMIWAVTNWRGRGAGGVLRRPLCQGTWYSPSCTTGARGFRRRPTRRSQR